MNVRFDNVDASNPEQCIAFLDVATSLGDVQRIKQRSYELLALQTGQMALDVGCGTGADVCELARLVGSNGLAIGVDSSQSMIKEARQRAMHLGLSVAFQQSDICALPFEDSFFDVCRADRVLHFLTAPLKALREMARVIVPGGRMVVSEPDWNTLQIYGGDDHLTAIIQAGSKIDPNAAANIGGRLPDLFAAAGLLVEQVIPERLQLQELNTCMGLFDLTGAARRAASTGWVTVGQANTWLRSIQEAAQHGQLRCTLSGHTVAGMKPLSGSLASWKPYVL
jgi:SAM-dependent methyltransferase